MKQVGMNLVWFEYDDANVPRYVDQSELEQLFSSGYMFVFQKVGGLSLLIKNFKNLIIFVN